MADEFDLKPTSRGEEFLDVILRSLGGETPDIPQPAWRYEEYLAAIAKAIQNGGGGTGGGVLVVHDVDNTLDKTWQEIHDAGFATLWLDDGGDVLLLDSCFAESGNYNVEFSSVSYGSTMYTASSADGYPVNSHA